MRWAVIDAPSAKPPGRPIGFLIIEMLSLPEYNALASVPLTLSSKLNSTSPHEARILGPFLRLFHARIHLRYTRAKPRYAGVSGRY